MRECDRLPDPYNDRVVKSVPRPPNAYLSQERVFPRGTDGQLAPTIDPELIKAYLGEGGRVSKECLLEIISRAKSILSSEPNLLRIQGQVIIVGDIHGQFFDLVWMLEKTKAKCG